jgi:hypothetical protein
MPENPPRKIYIPAGFFRPYPIMFGLIYMLIRTTICLKVIFTHLLQPLVNIAVAKDGYN